jgi:outer membrane protein assembly factor BamA
MAVSCCAVWIPGGAVHADDPEPGRTEFGFFPLVGGDTDLGIGGGAFASLARYEPGYDPYRFRLEVAGAITFKPAKDGLTIPFQDIYLNLTLPDLIRNRLRLEVRPSYTRETTLGYYGIGNAAPPPNFGSGSLAEKRYYQYGLTHPTLLLRLRLSLTEKIVLELGELLMFEQPEIHGGSLLAHDMANPALQRFFGSHGPHLLNLFEYTLQFDTRDEETSTRWGMFHQLRVRLSPGGVEPMPYRYTQLNLTLRAFTTYGDWTIAGRIVVDTMLGHPPFYELPRYEDTFALGGANGVRGIPAQRYSGKKKLFANLEVRVLLSTFRLIGLPCKLLGAMFFDAGRLWSDWPSDPALDGHGLGLKWGTGGGLRLQQGRAFVVRADVAWSPDARPIGAYVTSGQAF